MGFSVIEGDVTLLAKASVLRVRLDELVMARGHCSTLKEAQALIMAGQVLVNEERLDKPGMRVRHDSVIRIKGSNIPYVGRGGLKLQAALDRWVIDVEGRVAIDAGASTGGFTHCLLTRGCALVYSVDVGFGQLAGRLRQDPRVRNMERTNISDVRPEALDPRPSLGVMDLSYLSLSVAVPVVASLLDGDDQGREIVSLVKPLFEVPASGPGLSREQYRAALERVCGAGKGTGMGPVRLMASPVLGSSGTLEFLALFRPSPTASGPGPENDGMIAAALDEGQAVLEREHIRRSDRT
ncbi:MAG: Hemolysin A [Firmicutes bacterium ADurb.Bin506]|nr:MAG: Hemolysin A [Firmicutes bacterium ADurb.Bin506]